MPVTNYITANGMLVGEMTGGVMTAYGPDALGSVVATYSGSSLQNTYQYKPYGATLAKTGAAGDPSFLWNGGSGYRATSLTRASSYVRRRHVDSNQGRWISVDRKWPSELAYAYTNGNPITWLDPTGLGTQGSTNPTTGCHCCPELLQITQVQCYGAGSGKTPICSADSGPLDRGHIMTLIFAYDMDWPTQSALPGSCGFTISGGVWSTDAGVTTGPSALPDLLTNPGMIALQSCSIIKSSSCGFGKYCQANFVWVVPGAPANLSVDLPYGRKLTITYEFYPANQVTCQTLTKTFTQTLLWTSAGEPSTWLPKDGQN